MKFCCGGLLLKLQQNKVARATAKGKRTGVVKNFASSQISCGNLRDSSSQISKQLWRNEAEEGIEGEQKIGKLIPISQGEDEETSEEESDVEHDVLFGLARMSVPIGSAKVFHK